MPDHKIYKLILCLAAMIFIAKPFMGFSVFRHLQDKEETSLLVKVFAKRKPEFMEEATVRSSAIQELLLEKANAFTLTMNALLVTLFSLLTSLAGALLFTYSRSRYHTPLAVAPIYLRDRRLTI